MSKKTESAVRTQGISEICNEKWNFDKKSGILFKEGGEILLDTTENYIDDDAIELACDAVNNTYGAGIDPNAVPDLLKQLELALVMLAQSRFFGEDWQIHPNYYGITKAIEKAKLKI